MIVIVAVLFLLLGHAITLRLWPGAGSGALSPMERAVYSAIAGAAVWFGTTWCLALTGTFTRPVLIGRMVVVAVAVVALGGRDLFSAARDLLARRWDRTTLTMILVAVVPLLLWTQFVFWRSAIVPPLTHDALSYHLPKAVLIARDGGYEHQPRLSAAIRALPINYELVLAETILLDRSDRYTEWSSVLFYWLFITACAALAGRWWGAGLPMSLLTLLLAGATPVVLLHAGAHKNDLLVTALIICGLVASGRYLSLSDGKALLLGIAAFGMAAGAKPQAGLVAICISPFLLWRAWKVTETRLRTLAWAMLACVVSFALLGGAVYILNLVHEGSLLNARTPAGAERLGVSYGDWRSLGTGPYTLLAAPLSRDERALTVPWAKRPWFWRRYELYFSHLGLPFTIAAAMAPVGMLLWRRRRRGSALEIFGVTLAVLLAFVLILPVEFIPHGLYQISLPRYALFILPIALAWAMASWATLLSRPSRASLLVMIAAAVWFAAQAIEYGSRDVFVPLSYVAYARQHPDTRVVPFDPNRAASVADRAASPHDRIAVDSGFGTWIYPVFGAHLTRPVDFVADGRADSIHPDVQYVVIDRAYYILWRHPDFKDISQVRQYLGRGPLREEDARLFELLKRDSRFDLLFYNPRLNQAVFKRVRPQPEPVPPSSRAAPRVDP